ncbi:MAG: ABC transporter ATP-binding protein [Thermosulfidibacteraceae bacterium]
MSMIISFNNVSKTYKTRKGLTGEIKIRALSNVSFEIERGEKVAIVGESGSGKSTILKIIAGIESINEGSIKIGEFLIEAKNPKFPEEIKGKIQIVFQDPFSSLNPRLKIYQIISEPIEVRERKLKKEEKIEKAKYLLKLVGLNEDYLYRYPYQTSGGERQRIAIARAISTEPEIILLDEPTSSLDVFTQAHILNLLIDILEELKITSIFVTHNIVLALKIADKIVVMKEGRVVEIGSRDEILENPKEEYTKRLLRCSLIYS